MPNAKSDIKAVLQNYNNKYRVIHTVRHLGCVAFDLVVPLSAKFSLGRWKAGRIGRAVHATWRNTQIKVNTTHVSDRMNNPLVKIG